MPAPKKLITAAHLRSPTARESLPAQAEPYWLQLSPGRFLGYQRAQRRTSSSWRVRVLVGGKYHKARLATADDVAKGDGIHILSFKEAVDRAHTHAVVARPDTNAAVRYPRHAGGGASVNDIVADYHQHRATTPGGRSGRPMGESARKTSESSWRLHAGQSIGLIPVEALTPADVRRWHAGIASSPPVNRGKALPFDPADPEQVRARQETANRVLTIVKAALNLAWEQERLPHSILRDWWNAVQKFQTSDDTPPRMLDEAEVQRLLNATGRGGELRELVTAALMTGARAGELRLLNVQHYSPETGRLRIFQGKTGKTLTQPLTEEGVAFFEALTVGRRPSEPLLRRDGGARWERGAYRRAFQAAVDRANLQGVTFKTLRATYGKLLLLATKDIELVAKALGHSDTRVTRKHYAQYLPDELASGVAQMPAFGIEKDITVRSIRNAG
ncbi:site-specific integrase [Lysobacter sp. A6]|uniref:Site-specific integrase n=1 Tax=Noviluteimonas lactosilytica TaxID=2888523 RepID=A0ABS8JI32_9GAMM|nr:site-specific integrase [Lysobacter lactosilyticus]MCC8363267.1 site-specific integrase [Lysobacter lactosilyticus]